MHQNDELLKSAEELCQKAELHHQLIRGDKVGVTTCSPACTCNDTIQKLRQAICESINILESTKKAFKSKQLEILRRKLIDVLAEVR